MQSYHFFLFLTLFLISTPALADSSQSDSWGHSGPYDFELMSQTSVVYGIGNSTLEEQDSEFSRQDVSAGLTFGWLASDSVEPIVSAQYISSRLKFGQFETTLQSINAGVGVLFNFPLDRRTPDQKKLSENYRTPVFSFARHIPYGGLLASYTERRYGTGTEDIVKSQDGGIATKIVFGYRYMLYSRVGLNFFFAAYYDQDTVARDRVEETESSPQESTSNRLVVEGNVFSLSLFL